MAEIEEIAEGVTKILPYAFAEHRELIEVKFPASMTEIGKLAFYNCRNLRRISFWEGLREVEDGAFKNCGKLSELVIFSCKSTKAFGQSEQNIESNIKSHSAAGLKGILAESDGSFTVHFMSGAGTLYFPAYQQTYEENTAARIINQITDGIGVHYRECVREPGIDYQAYDSIFEKCIPVDEDAADRVAFYRSAFPWRLRKEMQERYFTYLHKNRNRVLSWLAEGEDLTLLRQWAELSVYKTEEEWRQAIEQMRTQNQWEAVSLLMRERQKRYGAKRKSFDL